MYSQRAVRTHHTKAVGGLSLDLDDRRTRDTGAVQIAETHAGEALLFGGTNAPSDRRMLKGVLLVARLKISRRDQHRNDGCSLPIAASSHGERTLGNESTAYRIGSRQAAGALPIPEEDDRNKLCTARADIKNLDLRVDARGIACPHAGEDISRKRHTLMPERESGPGMKPEDRGSSVSGTPPHTDGFPNGRLAALFTRRSAFL
jgi:hypothetical protein